MFCPKCATDNLEGAKFCRTCGANIALIPQALSGQLRSEPPGEIDLRERGSNHRSRRRDKKRDEREEPTIGDGVSAIFTGFGFLFAAIAIAIFGHAIAGQLWWFWLLIPAFGSIGKGVADVLAARHHMSGQSRIDSLPQSRVSALPARGAATPAPPPSVTEGTTRHLGSEIPRQYGATDNPKSLNRL